MYLYISSLLFFFFWGGASISKIFNLIKVFTILTEYSIEKEQESSYFKIKTE